MRVSRFAPALLTLCVAANAHAGSIFVTGHDPDFHSVDGDTAGAQSLLNKGVNYAKNGSAAPLLYIHDESNPVNFGHINSTDGINAAGITYTEMTAAQFATATLADYSAILVPSSYGGTLSQAEVDALDARSGDIIDYLNGGGGLVALAEDSDDASLATTNLFGFLPFLVTSDTLDEGENTDHVTAFGASIGFVDSDVNGNYSHNRFTSTGGMNVVDTDANGNIISLAYRGQITTGGVVPEPGVLSLMGFGALPMLGMLRKRRV